MEQKFSTILFSVMYQSKRVEEASVELHGSSLKLIAIYIITDNYFVMAYKTKKMQMMKLFNCIKNYIYFTQHWSLN